MKYDGLANRFLLTEPAGEFNPGNILPASLLPLNSKKKPSFGLVISFCLEKGGKLCEAGAIKKKCNEVSPVSCRWTAVIPEGLQ